MPKTKRNSLQVFSAAHTLVALSHLFVLTLLALSRKAAASANIDLSGCQDTCGDVTISYPFGIGPNCSYSKAFELMCNETINGTFAPYRGSYKYLNISLSLGQARVEMPISSQCYNSTTQAVNYTDWTANLQYFRFNHEKNKFVVIGCDTIGYINFTNHYNSYLGGCISACYSLDSLANGTCSGIGCCEISIPNGTNHIEVMFSKNYNNSRVYNFSRCGYAMLTEEDGFMFNTGYITTEKLLHENTTAVIDWFIENTTCDIAMANRSSYVCNSDHSICLNSRSGPGYFCNCSDGYQGNPYLKEGCQDINECDQNPCSKPGKCHNTQGGYKCSCPLGWRRKSTTTCELNLAVILGISAGIVALSFIGFSVYVVIQRIKLSEVMKQYFDQYGGWILLEKIKSNQGFGFTIFTKQQVEQATNYFDSANIIGHGGQGTVYKGTLSGQIVAIKKCKIVDENKKKEFGKEMLILSQISHKNIVKLLGCCLEIEVPMLVYEFIPNGTLFHYIHHKKQGSHISLETRLKIAQESAEALAYLHFSASPPIFHGDVKSSNILLDQNYTAKVSDFGASILAPTDEVQFVTLVQGTCGYLDPEYMQSCQLTDKSDVYSFGVVLLELLTSKPAINFDAAEEERSLSSCFLFAMKENKMKELLDDEIKCEDDIEVIMEVAELA